MYSALLVGLSTALAVTAFANPAKRIPTWPLYAGPGQYYIINQATGTVLNLDGGSPQAGTPITGEYVLGIYPPPISSQLTVLQLAYSWKWGSDLAGSECGAGQWDDNYGSLDQCVYWVDC